MTKRNHLAFFLKGFFFALGGMAAAASVAAVTSMVAGAIEKHVLPPPTQPSSFSGGPRVGRLP